MPSFSFIFFFRWAALLSGLFIIYIFFGKLKSEFALSSNICPGDITDNIKQLENEKLLHKIITMNYCKLFINQ